MKIAVFFTLSVIFCVVQSAIKGYVKPIKIIWKQTGTKYVGVNIKLIPVTRYETTLDASCDNLTRPLDKGFMNFRISAKTATMQNYRHLISLNKIEPCRIMADRNFFPLANYFIDRARELYPEYVHPCPYTEVKLKNITLSFLQNPTKSDLEAFTRMNFHFPNGVYKLHAYAWDGTGDAFNLTCWVEVKYRKYMTTDLSEM